MYLIDTNIFLELFLDQEKSVQCEKFLQEVSEGRHNCYVSHFTVHAIEAHLGDKPVKIEKILNSIIKSIGLDICYTDLKEELLVTELMEEKDLTFDDALLYQIAERQGIDAIVSFDTDFDETEIKRIEPQKLVE